MVNARRMEFAIARGLGAGKVRVFFSFFLEQTLLCLCGIALGCALLCFAGEASTWWWAAALFALCYLLGSAVSVIAVGRTHLMSLLSERE
ncbi:MAG: ABC transporter permease, partial [Oscillospiraceae bacterium]|nr:ABC transporter permease [Oscillospiraceae bacterium]